MSPDLKTALTHYETFLARHYLWMAGGFEENGERNRRFFAMHGIVPVTGGVAIDLGAGCGFQSVPLARAGFRVVAVESSRQMLEVLVHQTGDLPIRPFHGDMLSFEEWGGREPELIVCMGDTLTHLPDISAVRSLVRHSARELVPGGKLIVSFRDYSRKPADSPVVIPVRRDNDSIFLCRLDYGEDIVTVEDILYSQKSGTWTRVAGTYPRIRPAPELLMKILANEGLAAREPETESGMVTIIAEKPVQLP